MRNKTSIIISLIVLLLVMTGWSIWHFLASPTRVALVSFQPYISSGLILSNSDDFIKYETVGIEELDKLNQYDFVMGFAMGIKIDAAQREQILEAGKSGLPMIFFAATTPENDICTLDSIQKSRVEGYFNNGNKKNYQSLAHYIRHSIDKKQLFVTNPDSAVKSAVDVLFHLDDSKSFSTVVEYEQYLRSIGHFIEGAPKVAVVGGMNDPFSGNRENIDSLIVSFERAGFNIYPVHSSAKKLNFLKEISPDAVINFPHGRMIAGQADAAVEWLKERNVPMFAPLTVLQSRAEWEKDPMGMMGGFMAQSVMMPELDGGIYPYVITSQEKNNDGLYIFKSIPDRLESFTQIVANFVALKKKSNAEKKVAIYYFKGVGKQTLTAQGLETIPSIYNLLKRLKNEGYNVSNLPENIKDFEAMLMIQGSVLSTYAEGAYDEYLKNGNPALVEKSVYESWIKKSLPADLYAQVVDTYGEAPGNYMAVMKEGKQHIAVARVQFGNIVLLPQPMAALGGDAFAIVHGAKSPPPHTYIASYLWTQHGLKADAMIHFGTHGSLEFTPEKQVALSNYDWPDRMVGTVPHFYYYTIGNIGESVMTKRRTYATTISYLTPPFMESQMRSQFKYLQDKIRYYHNTSEASQDKASLEIKMIAVQMGLHRDLRIDSSLNKPLKAEDIDRIDNFAEEISNEKMNGEMYTTGNAYTTEKLHTTVIAMSADPIAFSLAAIDRQRGTVTNDQLKSKSFFTQRYLVYAKNLVNQILKGKMLDEADICKIANITTEQLADARKIMAPKRRPSNMANSSTKTPTKGDTTDKKVKENVEKSIQYSKEDKAFARAVLEFERTLKNVINYKNALEQSPELELNAFVRGLGGGYIAPGPGGDAVANPNAIPTGRNLYSINAETTPSEAAWDKGVSLAQETLEQYKRQHGNYPRKVSYTFWSSEFIESEGATIAQVLYMVGVAPVRDTYGRVSDLQLIDSKDLGRPRIDVVVQTSGQFRDLAASRLALITRAIEMAAAAKDNEFENLVAKSTTETERLLVEQGISPKEAREMSTQRVFGGANGMYGTNIQGMITSGDKWENEKDIADTYINNMGALYGNEKNWGQHQAGLLRAVLHNADLIIQPRQNNTWGALSLDHVYEFMGGMNLAVRSVTGKDPDAYFADYRNRNNFKMQELKEAIGIESRATILNPTYVKEVMKGGASSAAQIQEVVTNTYGWNVTKPQVINDELWNEMYEVYVKDKFNIGATKFFERENPAAMQEITAVMLETARKGMWNASDVQLKELASLHTYLVKAYGANGSGFSGGNKKLQSFITGKVTTSSASNYNAQLDKVNNAPSSSSTKQNGMVLKKQQLAGAEATEKSSINGLIVLGVTLAAFLVLLIVIRKRYKK